MSFNQPSDFGKIVLALGVAVPMCISLVLIYQRHTSLTNKAAEQSEVAYQLDEQGNLKVRRALEVQEEARARLKEALDNQIEHQGRLVDGPTNLPPEAGDVILHDDHGVKVHRLFDLSTSAMAHFIDTYPNYKCHCVNEKFCDCWEQ